MLLYHSAATNEAVAKIQWLSSRVPNYWAWLGMFGGDGGVWAFWSISSKESGCWRLKYRSCSPVWLLSLLMFLLSAILSSILAVGVMRNMLGWCYFCCFLTAVIVPQCSWRKAMFSCEKEGKRKKNNKTLSKSKSRPEEGALRLVDADFCAKVAPVDGCSHGMVCTHTGSHWSPSWSFSSSWLTVRAAGWDAPAALQL